MTIHFITGASGVGKTTLVQALQEKYAGRDNLFCMHFDSVGVPATADMIAEYGSPSNWQKQQTFDWIERLIALDAETIIFEGQVNLDFIKEGFSRVAFTDYTVTLLDCDVATMQARLSQRGSEDLFTPDMINWLAYLRNQAVERDVDIIDTSQLSVEEIIVQLNLPDL